jgi:hypothetical protein
MKRFLFLFGIPVLVLLSFSAGLAVEIARDNQETKSTPVQNNLTRFDVLVSQSFFESRFKLKKPFPINFLPMNFLPINPLRDTSFALFPRIEIRSTEEKMADRFWVISQYPGGEILYDALCVGLEFVTFSKDITTYGNSYFRTGYDFGSTRHELRTGFFYSF